MGVMSPAKTESCSTNVTLVIVPLVKVIALIDLSQIYRSEEVKEVDIESVLRLLKQPIGDMVFAATGASNLIRSSPSIRVRSSRKLNVIDG